MAGLLTYSRSDAFPYIQWRVDSERWAGAYSSGPVRELHPIPF
jgi:hypothetical protein